MFQSQREEYSKNPLNRMRHETVAYRIESYFENNKIAWHSEVDAMYKGTGYPDLMPLHEVLFKNGIVSSLFILDQNDCEILLEEIHKLYTLIIKLS